MNTYLKYFFQFCLFLFVQVYVLNQVFPLHYAFVPYLYFLFILWLPLSIHKGFLLIIAFCLGFTLDCFMGIYGLHAAPCVLIAYLRPYILAGLMEKDSATATYFYPNSHNLGIIPYFFYILILTFLHNFYLSFLEYLYIGNFLNFLVKVLGLTAESLLLILITELIFYKKRKYEPISMN